MAELKHVKFKADVTAEMIRRGLRQEDLVRPSLSLNTIRMFMSNPPCARKQGRSPSISVANKIAYQLGININDYMED